MKRLTITRSGPLPERSQVDAFATQNTGTLPNDFVEFLLTQNPGTVEESLFTSGSDRYVISVFYPFDPDDELSLQKGFGYLNDFFQGNYLAFGGDPGGWQFVLSLQERDYGKVYFCRMDEEPGTGLKPVADSFEAFVNGLQRDDFAA